MSSTFSSTIFCIASSLTPDEFVDELFDEFFAVHPPFKQYFLRSAKVVISFPSFVISGVGIGRIAPEGP